MRCKENETISVHYVCDEYILIVCRFVVLEPHEIPQHDNMYALLAFVQNVDSAMLPSQYHREFSADSVESMDEWIHAIQEAITSCNNRSNPLPASGETTSMKRKLKTMLCYANHTRRRNG